MRDELLKGLSEDQIKKVKECKSSEEILALAKAEGIELNDEQLEAVSGGACGKTENKCPKCGSKEYDTAGSDDSKGMITCRCKKCGHIWIYG